MATNAIAGLDRHWASVSTAELPAIVKAMGDAYWQDITSRGLLDIWRRSERTYYGLDQYGGWKDSCAVTFSGEDGENVLARLNHYRSIGQAILAIAGHERPAFVAKAVNDKTRSLVEAPLATGLVTSFWHDWELEKRTSEQDEAALVYGIGFVHLRWSIHEGKTVTAEDGTSRKEGDVIADMAPPWRCIHDLANTEHPEYAIVAHEESVWDLAARYPQMAEQIVRLRGAGSYKWPRDVWGEPWRSEEMGQDRATVWCVYQRPTDAIPNGRYAVVCGDLCFVDEPAILPDRVPVIPMLAAKQLGRNTGYSALWDLLVAQELYDMGESTLATANEGGVGSWTVPKDSGVIPGDLAGNRKFIEYEIRPELTSGGKPEPLAHNPIESDRYEYPDRIQSKMETISGVNSVARGEPDSNLKSGAALALVQSLAVQFNSRFQAARIQAREDIATCGYHLVKRTMQSPKLARRKGSGDSEYLTPVTAEELEEVESVTIEVGPPLMNQAAGRLEIADKLLDRQLVTTPEQYIQILNTGRIDPLLKAPTAQLNVLSAENDMLHEGKMPPVREGQDHATHVREHQAMLTPDMDPMIAKVIGDHCTEHYTMWSQMPPDLAALTGQSVMPPPPPMAPPGPPPADGPPPKGGQSPKPPTPGRASPLGAPPSQAMPMMPSNPLTGERAPVPQP